jgi:hypothetical protein
MSAAKGREPKRDVRFGSIADILDSNDANRKTAFETVFPKGQNLSLLAFGLDYRRRSLALANRSLAYASREAEGESHGADYNQ